MCTSLESDVGDFERRCIGAWESKGAWDQCHVYPPRNSRALGIVKGLLNKINQR